MQRFRQSRLFTRCGAVVGPLVLLAAVAVAFSADRAPSARKTPPCSVETLEGDYRGTSRG